MNTKRFTLLLRTMLKQSSGITTLKNSTDPKRKKRARGGYIGMAILLIMLFGYSLLGAIGFGSMGMAQVIPPMCAVSISAVSFLFTLLRANGYLFGFKEYDMLMAMPFEVKEIVACKFLYMYIKNLAFYLCISLSMMVGYGIYANPPVYVYLIWIILATLLPVIPNVIASALGILIVRISTSFRHAKLLQTILTFIFIILCFSLRFIVEAIFKNSEVSDTLLGLSAGINASEKYYFPAKWFSMAINDANLVSFAGFILISVVVFVIFYELTSRSYQRINSNLKVGSSNKDFKLDSTQKKNKKHSKVNAIAYKELKRLLGSTVYITNACFGEVLIVIFGIASLFVSGDRLVALVTQDAPIPSEALIAVVPFILFFFIGMVSTTCMTPSLEGRNLWIMQSMPITKKEMYQGKLLFNLALKTPFMLFGCITLSFSFRVGLANAILILVLCILMLIYSSCWGLVCGIKHIRLDWENEIEVVKQGTAVALYLLPNMFLTMIIAVGAVVLSLVITTTVSLIACIALYAILAGVSYLWVCKKAFQ